MVSKAATQLRAWRDSNGFSQAQACQALGGFDQSVFSKLERGKRTPTRTQSVLIERVTGVSVEAWDESMASKRTRAA